MTTDGIRCYFPFIDNGRYQVGCSSSSTNNAEKFCRVGHGQTGALKRCSNKFKGLWSSWSDRECSQPCGGGVVMFKRDCLYTPCSGEATQLTTEPCNTHDCYDHILIAMGGSVQKLGGEKCVFPFVMRGITYENCIPRARCEHGCKEGNSQVPMGFDNQICSLSYKHVSSNIVK